MADPVPISTIYPLPMGGRSPLSIEPWAMGNDCQSQVSTASSSSLPCWRLIRSRRAHRQKPSSPPHATQRRPLASSYAPNARRAYPLNTFADVVARAKGTDDILPSATLANNGDDALPKQRNASAGRLSEAERRTWYVVQHTRDSSGVTCTANLFFSPQRTRRHYVETS